jgi:hypothetical protein
MIKEALRRIQECTEYNTIYLDLSNLNLTSLDLSNLSTNMPNSLISLNVKNNQLSVSPNNLPDTIKYLFLDNNQLSDLSIKLKHKIKYIFYNNKEYLFKKDAILRIQKYHRWNKIKNKIKRIVVTNRLIEDCKYVKTISILISQYY